MVGNSMRYWLDLAVISAFVGWRDLRRSEGNGGASGARHSKQIKNTFAAQKSPPFAQDAAENGAAGVQRGYQPALDTRRPVFCGVLSKRWGFLRGKSVLDLFRMPRSARAAIPLAAPQIAPTDERRNHGKIEPVPHAIADHHGRSARPFRAVDTLTAMERRGTITAAMRQAAEDFRSRFAVAQLDPLRALDYLQPRTGK